MAFLSLVTHGEKRKANLRCDKSFLWCFRRRQLQGRRSPVLLKSQLQLRSPLRLQLQLQPIQESVSASVKVLTFPAFYDVYLQQIWLNITLSNQELPVCLFVWVLFVFLARCGWADHTGPAHWRLWGSCGALSPWQPNGRQHYTGHCRRGWALRENPEEVFYQSTQQDNQGNDKETCYWGFTTWKFIREDLIMPLSCSWSVRWWWKTGMTSWRRVTCRTGRRLWLPSWPTLSLRSSRPCVVSSSQSPYGAFLC